MPSVGRFPEPIPEASESLVVHYTSSSSPEVDDCHLHHRGGGGGGGSGSGGGGGGDIPGVLLAQAETPPQTRRRREKGFASTCARLRRSAFARKYLGRIQVFRRVVTNPIWLGVTASTVTENTIVSAYLTYAAKYLQAQFRVPAHLACIHTGVCVCCVLVSASPPPPRIMRSSSIALLVGAVVVPSAVLGVLSGALLMRHFRPSISRTLLSCLVPLFATLTTLLVLLLGLNCSSNQMAGVTASYDGKANWQFGAFFPEHSDSNLTAGCNSVCRVGGSATSCPLASDYNPVCWEGAEEARMSFLNPCLAGCSGQRLEAAGGARLVEVFTDCNCVTNSSLVPEGVHRHGGRLRGGTTKKGACNPQCPHYVPFLLVTFITIFLTSVNQNPCNVVTLRWGKETNKNLFCVFNFKPKKLCLLW